MAFTLHQKVIWIANDPGTRPMRKRIMEGTVTKVGLDRVYVNGQHKAEDHISISLLWPDLPGPRKLLEDTLEMGARHEAEEEAMFERALQLRMLCASDKGEK